MNVHERLGRTRRIALALLVASQVLWAGGCSGPGDAKTAGGNQGPATPVVVSQAVSQPVPEVLEAPGSLVAVNSVAIRARVDGELREAGFTEGEEVKAGQVLFRIDPRPFAAALAVAGANLARDEATLERNQAQLHRYDSLASSDYVAPDDYAQVKANVATAAAAAAADKAALQAAQLNLDYCTIRTPTAGRSGIIAVRPGNLIKATDGTVLTTVTQMDPVYVDFALPERYLDKVRQNLATATVTIAMADGPDAVYTHATQLDFIDNNVDPATGTVHVRATAANRDRALWPGQFVHVMLRLETPARSIVVPTTAIGSGPDGNFVFVVDASGHARQRPVVVSRETADLALVVKGLSVGETVVVDGQSRLKDGMPVKVATAGTGS